MEQDVAACTGCHADLEDFNYNGVQTEVEALIEELGELLIAKGLLDEEGDMVVGFYPEAEAWALWNYILIDIEDSSSGVHNMKYLAALAQLTLEKLAGEYVIGVETL